MSAIEVTQRAAPAAVTVFRLLERITLENFAEVEALTKEAHANGTRSLVLDLSGVDSLSSIGVRAIVVMHKILAKDGGNPLKLAGVSPGIREVLKISGITKFIEIHETVDEATATFPH